MSHDPEITATPFLVNSYVLLPKPLPHLAPHTLFLPGEHFFEMILTCHHSVITPQTEHMAFLCLQDSAIAHFNRVS